MRDKLSVSELIIFTTVLFGNYWIFNFILAKDFLKVSFMIILSIAIFFFQKLGRKKYLILIIPLLIILITAKKEFSIFNLSWEEVQIINQRRGYFDSKTLGKVSENKLLKYSDKYQKNFFEGLDINYYFFGTHPRERVGIKEIKKFPFIYIPLFLYGIYFSLKRKDYFVFYYSFLVLAPASLFNPIDKYSYLLFPAIVFFTYLGFLRTVSIIKTKIWRVN